ncbi:SGNH/GDSL hydrolase family protein [Demequina sp. NBRC 110055]|uniref:SGNH/GDSL hydrolase family protein n=1 Tax=Demequina sp. NBRC 110055 TaxID=1570344 RepID=UPI00190EA7C8|nr:SGNH/GDSL hydrolase family protein [Demequina sp. NBRC 110055]
MGEPPLSLHGLSHVDARAQEFWRLPPDLIASLPEPYERLGRRPAGGRVRFATNATSFTVRLVLKTESVDPTMALPAAAGADVYIGAGMGARFVGQVAPRAYGYAGVPFEVSIVKGPGWETVTINLPRNEQIESLEVDLPPSARLTVAPSYRHAAPIVFYGSSITEGAAAPRPGAAYTSTVARWLDSDHLNYGFSGNAQGEQAVAAHIAAHDALTAFVLDYDHNAPTVEHLDLTHRPFFETVRAAHPDIPVLIMTRPEVDADPEDSARRRDVAMETFLTARADGDRQVWFLDGHELFGTVGREECTIDRLHPTSLGFHRMAVRVHAVLKRALNLN